MIHFSKCKIPYPHNFEDYSCRKCNAFLMIADGNVMIKGKKVSKKIFVFNLTMMLVFFIFLINLIPLIPLNKIQNRKLSIKDVYYLHPR